MNQTVKQVMSRLSVSYSSILKCWLLWCPAYGIVRSQPGFKDTDSAVKWALEHGYEVN